MPPLWAISQRRSVGSFSGREKQESAAKKLRSQSCSAESALSLLLTTKTVRHQALVTTFQQFIRRQAG